MKPSINWKQRSKFLFFWLIAGFFEGLFLFSLERSWTAAIGCHAVATASLIFSCRDRKWEAVFLLLVGFFPVFGWLLSPFFYFRVSATSVIFLIPEEEMWRSGSDIRPIFFTETRSRRERIARDLDFLPLSDILASHDINLKRGAILRLAELKNPEAVRLMMDHRSDPSMDVRFFVTSALSRIKRELDQELEAAKKEMKKNIYQVSARIFLSKVYFQYVNLGLLDPLTANAHETEAQYHLDFAVQSEEASVEAFQILIDIYLKRKNWKQALLVADLLKARGKATVEELAKIRIDILYRSGQLVEIPRVLAENKVSFSDPLWQSAASWWRGG